MINRRGFFSGLMAVAALAAAPALFVARKLYWVNVLDYGADPLGIRDSTPAFHAAVNALGDDGGTVYVPPGFYRGINA